MQNTTPSAHPTPTTHTGGWGTSLALEAAFSEKQGLPLSQTGRDSQSEVWTDTASLPGLR